MSCWLISVPNEGKTSESTYQQVKNDTASTKNDLAECYKFELPNDLLVGTLDSLMALSDDLVRTDMVIESVVRKIERQFTDLNPGDEALTIDGVPVDRYLNYFAWDEAKHPHRRPLVEIVSSIQTTMGKVDDELKQLASMYTEKRQALAALQRKKGGNLMIANLDNILTPDVVSERDFVNTEYLQTLVVVVPKNLEEKFLEEYTTLGADIAQFGPSEKRDSVRGSPVVPNSAKKWYAEGDSLLYTVTMLKGQYQAGFVDDDGNFEQGTTVDYIEDFKTKAREHKYIVRDFTFNPTAHQENVAAMAELDVEVDRLWSGLLRWCKAHYGEAFVAWMHIKAIRVFVESVLRYGLPVDFVVMLFRPQKGKDKKLRSYLAKAYGHLEPANLAGKDESAQGAAGAAQAEYFPYVSNTFSTTTA